MLDFKQIQGADSQGEMMLIQTDDWFVAPNGMKYQSVWGRCRVVDAKEVLGFRPASSTNWYLHVSNGESHFLIAGCRIHYAHIVPNEPKGNDTYKLI